MKNGKIIALVLSILMLAGLLPASALADDAASYVLMNIPYREFYRAELGDGADVDAISAATVNKRNNGSLAAGTYHAGAEGEGIDGVIYPVLVKDLSVLDRARQVTDENSVTVTTRARGETITTTYEGRDALFEAADYSWYLLTEQPAHYKELTVNADGSFSFGAVSGEVTTRAGVTGEITYNARHADVEIALSGTEGIEQSDAVSAVIVTTEDGESYGLAHVRNIWRATEIGWDGDALMKAGKGAVSVANIRYITQEAVIDYPVQINIEARGEAGSTDLDGTAWYADAAAWAVEQGYLGNRGDERFDAGKPLRRGEIVSYLWSAAGEPETALPESPFADVTGETEGYQAVIWAFAEGLTEGNGDGTLGPDGALDRAELVTLLWKETGKPTPAGTENSFNDVPEDAPYRDAVLWAAENGVTEGTGEGRFSPEAAVNLGQLVTFLYKYGMSATVSASRLLKDVTGTYDELFTVICDTVYDQIWLDQCAAIVGEELAPECAEMLKTACTGTIYGQEAVASYANVPEKARFDCFFTSGVARLVFEGRSISGLDEQGNTIFAHEYGFVREFSIGEMLNGYLYETADADAGEFRYFVLLPDTPASTYHIEFRYGSDADALAEYAEGPYAYWLAAGISTLRDDTMIDNVIGLFAEENLAEAQN